MDYKQSEATKDSFDESRLPPIIMRVALFHCTLVLLVKGRYISLVRKTALGTNCIRACWYYLYFDPISIEQWCSLGYNANICRLRSVF